ncbi:tubulin polyglutamylase TTLL11-like isoform X2 [Convolutriloba macropyga]|uniref:tubulin polyglutamylase TTLL11-like isoform X2 n=1 Tax=Convolutriloba macropyga TaxID=536237 RepID=UPI003F520C7D
MLANQTAVLVSQPVEQHASGTIKRNSKEKKSNPKKESTTVDENEPYLVGELLDFSDLPIQPTTASISTSDNDKFLPKSPSSFDLLKQQHGDIALEHLKRVLLPVEIDESKERNAGNANNVPSLVVQSGNAGHDHTRPLASAHHLKEPVKPQLTNREYRHERPHVFVDTSHAKTSVQVMKLCLEDLGWYEIRNHFQHSSMRAMRLPDIFWHACSFEDTPCIPFNSNIRINKFPGMVQIVRKQSLTYAIRRLQQFFPTEFSFYPRSWNIPDEYPQLVYDHDKLTHGGKHSKLWLIFKPDDASQGSGIFLEDNPRNIDPGLPRNYLVQEYIANPLLIDGLKFDFRIYVLLRNLRNVEIFLSREGMVRFCTLKYEMPSTSNKSKVYMHLTNYSLNKYSETYDYNNSMTKGSKRLLSSVFNYLQAEGYDVSSLWTKIELISVKTVFAILPDLKVAYRDEIPPNKEGPQCFQILGFDILIDENFEPHLLEVNANPSLNLDHEIEIGEDGVTVGHPAPNHPGYQLVHSPVDEEIKRPVVLESLLLACPMSHRHKTLRFLTKYGVQCAVHYPDGQFSNNDDPIRQEPCLYLIYNQEDNTLDHMRVLDDVVTLYVYVMGNRSNRGTHSAFRSFMSGTMTLSWTKSDFRRFMRKTRLVSSGGANAASVDLLFIKMTKRWFHNGPAGNSPGLTFDAFVDTFIELAMRRYSDYEYSRLEKVKLLLKHCIMALQIPEDFHWYPDTSGGDTGGESETQNNGQMNNSRKGNSEKGMHSNKDTEKDSSQKPKVLGLRASSEKPSLLSSKDVQLEATLKLQNQARVNSNSSHSPGKSSNSRTIVIPAKTNPREKQSKAVSRIPKLNYRQSNFPLFSAHGKRDSDSGKFKSRLPVQSIQKDLTQKPSMEESLGNNTGSPIQVKKSNSPSKRSIKFATVNSDEYDSDFFSM